MPSIGEKAHIRCFIPVGASGAVKPTRSLIPKADLALKRTSTKGLINKDGRSKLESGHIVFHMPHRPHHPLGIDCRARRTATDQPQHDGPVGCLPRKVSEAPIARSLMI
jgi:hypothetical protein